jgi:hypothetical protein
MKTTLILTAALIGGIALPAAVFAGPTENITGCATEAVEGSNYTTTVEPGCLQSTGGTSSDGFLLAALSIWADQRAEAAAEAAK